LFKIKRVSTVLLAASGHGLAFLCIAKGGVKDYLAPLTARPSRLFSSRIWIERKLKTGKIWTKAFRNPAGASPPRQ
jgi:hypothetical protein